MLRTIIYIGLYILAITGSWILLSSFIVLPSPKHNKTIKLYQSGNSEEKFTSNPIDTFLETYSKKFAKYIKLNPIKRSEMSKQLYMANNPKTPEEYTAYMIVVAASILIVGLILMILNKFIGIVVCALAIISYIYFARQLKTNMQTSLKEFESELPRYVAYLKQSFASKTNVINIMEKYVCKNDYFMKEMTQTLADAKTSNFDSAMARLDQRINSERLKMVIRGLTSAYHGDDVKSYFAMLERDFTAFEINDLKRSVKSIPRKMQTAKILILASIMITLFFPLVMQIIESFNGLFETGGTSR